MKSLIPLFVFVASALAGDESSLGSTIIADDEPSLLEAFSGGQQQVDFLAEGLFADDIQVQSTSLTYGNSFGPWTLSLGIGQNHYIVDYSSVFTTATPRLKEETTLGNISLDYAWNKKWSTDIHASAYNGFAEYRSIWIAEFYRTANSGAPSYREPDPHGHGFGTTIRWDYLPQSGSVTLSLDYARDTIAPGYDFNIPQLRVIPGGDKLDTVSGTLSIDQAINGWLTTNLSLAARETTDREPRYSVENAWAAAFGPFALRLTGGFTQEDPDFEALYGGAVLEWNFHSQWFAFVGARIYSDTGEIETSGFSTAAPGLESSEIYAGLLWDSGSLAVNLGVGFLNSNYDPLDASNQFLGNLYRDRNWYSLRAAASYRF